MTIRGKHGSHELDGPTNQELLQGENWRTRPYIIFAGKNRGNILSISRTKSIQWSPNPQECHGFPTKLESSTGKKNSPEQNQHGKTPQVFPTFFLKVNGLPGRHAPAAHFKRPGQGWVSPIFFAELFFLSFNSKKCRTSREILNYDVDEVWWDNSMFQRRFEPFKTLSPHKISQISEILHELIGGLSHLSHDFWWFLLGFHMFSSKVVQDFATFPAVPGDVKCWLPLRELEWPAISP